MKKSQKVQAEDEPVMLDTFPKTLRDHTAAQHETSIDSSFGHEVDVENRGSGEKITKSLRRIAIKDGFELSEFMRADCEEGFEKCGGYGAKSETISIIEMD